MTLTRVYIVACKCGGMALNMSRTYEKACHVAQAHKDLNPTLCSPTIFADDVPTVLAPTRPVRTRTWKTCECGLAISLHATTCSLCGTDDGS